MTKQAEVQKRGPGRPALAEEVERLSLSLPKPLADMARERAKKEGVSLGEWMRRAAHYALADKARMEAALALARKALGHHHDEEGSPGAAADQDRALKAIEEIILK